MPYKTTWCSDCLRGSKDRCKIIQGWSTQNIQIDAASVDERNVASNWKNWGGKRIW